MAAPAPQIQRIVLIGFSATGKSAVAHALALHLGWTSIDTDDLIERTTARSVPDIFAHDGEPAFRALEREAAAQAATLPNTVVATGGGLWLDAANRAALCDGGFVVALEARWDTILARHASAESARPDARPLLAGPLASSNDPVQTVRRLKASRQALYA
ncbi:MAG: shikimate kinase, partial [Chloroflexi bacterium]